MYLVSFLNDHVSKFVIFFKDRLSKNIITIIMNVSKEHNIVSGLWEDGITEAF